MANTSKEYQEDLFKAIDTIVQSRIADLPFDKTIECKVVDITKANKGIYKVDYLGVEFEATSNIYNLAVDDVVYVLVPQNDFRKAKNIVALKGMSETLNIKTLPFLSFIRGNNLFSAVLSANEYNVKLNSGRLITTEFYFTLFSGEDYIYGFTRMGVKTSILAGVNTPLVSGNYGIKITINGIDLKLLAANYDSTILTDARGHYGTDKRYYKDFILNKSDMIGTNLYNTHGYLNLEKVFDITGWIIDSVTVSLWLDDDFKDKNGTLINDKYITFSNLGLYFGYDLKEFQNNPNNIDKDTLRITRVSLVSNMTSLLKKLDNSLLTDSELFAIQDTINTYADEIRDIDKLLAKNIDYYIRIRTKDGLLYVPPSALEYIKKKFELYALKIDFDTNTYLDLSSNIKNRYRMIEYYDPTHNSISLRSNKYSFKALSDEPTYFNKDLTELGNIEVTLNPHFEFPDARQSGFVVLIYDSYSDGVNELAANMVSNELWFVDLSRSASLTELYNTGIVYDDSNATIISGLLIYSGPELLFKASDGTVLLRLNVNNTLLMGNAATATGFKKDNNIYNLAETFTKINSALLALGAGNQYKLF